MIPLSQSTESLYLLLEDIKYQRQTLKSFVFIKNKKKKERLHTTELHFDFETHRNQEFHAHIHTGSPCHASREEVSEQRRHHF